MTNDASSLPLIHRVAAARSGEAPHPALILLHGIGSDEADLLAVAPQVDSRLFVISVRAPTPYGGYGYSWYDLEQGYGQSESMLASLDLVQRFLAAAPDIYPIDRERVYLGGFSQGAAMTLATALLRPEMVAAAVALSGYLPPDLPYASVDPRGLPIFQAHGTYDQVVPLNAAHLTRDALSGMPVDLTYREYPMAHQVSMPELIELGGWMNTLLERGWSANRSDSASRQA